jgi:antitoxin (DNA-binding transcriptional repressor) of toxin-antitoxin stability system
VTENTTIARVGVRELRNNLSALMHQVRGGSIVHVIHRDKVIAELRPPPPAQANGPRRLGALKGRIWIDPDFDETPPGRSPRTRRSSPTTRMAGVAA